MVSLNPLQIPEVQVISPTDSQAESVLENNLATPKRITSPQTPNMQKYQNSPPATTPNYASSVRALPQLCSETPVSSHGRYDLSTVRTPSSKPIFPLPGKRPKFNLPPRPKSDMNRSNISSAQSYITPRTKKTVEEWLKASGTTTKCSPSPYNFRALREKIGSRPVSSVQKQPFADTTTPLRVQSMQQVSNEIYVLFDIICEPILNQLFFTVSY